MKVLFLLTEKETLIRRGLYVPEESFERDRYFFVRMRVSQVVGCAWGSLLPGWSCFSTCPPSYSTSASCHRNRKPCHLWKGCLDWHTAHNPTKSVQCPGNEIYIQRMVQGCLIHRKGKSDNSLFLCITEAFLCIVEKQARLLFQTWHGSVKLKQDQCESRLVSLGEESCSAYNDPLWSKSEFSI